MFESFLKTEKSPEEELHEDSINKACKVLAEQRPKDKETINALGIVINAFERPIVEMPETESKED